MKIRKTTAGFTLTELVLAVAILTILLGLATVNVIQYLRTLTQLERDGIAREIFVAAQNHLTMAESQGFLGVSNPGVAYDNNGIFYLVSKNSEEEPGLLGEEDEEEEAEETAQPLAPDMLYDVMLPFASVDETVRSGGSYVIRYQKNPALVLDVFYVAQSGRFTHNNEHNKQGFTDYTTAEVRSLVDGYSSSLKKGDRQRYGTDEAVIGWYGAEGGATPDLTPGDALKPPSINVTNAERLSVDVVNPNHLIGEAGLHLIIKGEQSGNVRAIDLIDKTGALATGYTDKSSFHVVLDDVTSEKPNEHFCILCKDLFPGENIIVYAEAYNNNKLTNIARSADATTNSLFASLSISQDDNPYDTGAVEISNFRHLENLDKKISNITIQTVSTVAQDRDYYSMSTTPKPVRIMQAKQTGNLDWPTFESRTGNYVYYLDNPVLKTLKAGAEKCYLPITKSGMITYNGQGNEISNVKIDVSGEAGLFATLGNSSEVKNLKLLNFSVKSSGGAAGALAGVLNNSTVNGVLARHETDKSGDDYKIAGKTSVGGLVGQIKNSIEPSPRGDVPAIISQSAAAVKVLSTNGDAGGLIGTIETDSATFTTVENSYAGGHVISKDTDGNPIVATYDKINCNVTGKNAGGLIGSSSAGTLKVLNCYATTSANGATNAGGLIGAMTGGEIKNCYATGYVRGATADVFVGVPGTATYEGNGYFSYTSVVTGTTDLVNVKSIPNWDGDATAYGAGNSKPYDQFLRDNYTKGPEYPDESLYTFLNIVELNRRTTPGWNSDVTWMTTHYGDWPPLDTLVINTSS